MDNGNLTVTANAVDLEGNPSNDSTTITLDNQAPNAPTITTPIEGDNIVNSVEDNDVYVAGTAEKNSTVKVTFTDGTHTEQVTVTTNDQGEWNLTGNEVDLSGFNNGSVQVSATATDTAGNTSAAQTVDITLDNQTTPVTIDTPIAQDNVISDSEDNGVVIKGNAEPNSQVTVTISDGKNPPVTTQVTANNQGEWTAAGLDISGLDNGNLTVTANAIDPEGNPSNDSTNITLDNQAPNAPTITTPIEGDNIVNSVEDNDVYVAGTAEKNSTVTVTFTDGTHTEQVTVTTNDQGEWNLTGNEVDLSGFNNGTIQVSATATDTAGNTSPAQTVDITLDNQTTPVTIDTPIAQDNVINGSEDNGVAIKGNAEAGSTVTITISDGKNPPVTTQVTANNQGEWTTAGVDISGLDNGNLTVTASAIDPEGNPSNDSTTITLDNQAPNAPTITTPIEGDNIVNSVEDNDVYVAGTAEKNSTVTVTFTDGTHTEQVTVTTNDQGEWNLTGNEIDLSGFNNGTIQVSATATDTAGNTSAAQTVDITLDNQTTPLTIDTPIAQDNVINGSEDNGVVISGNAEPNSQVTVTINDGKNPPVATQVTANNQGEWTTAGLDISGLDNGNLTVTANAIDPEGNPSNDSTTITLDNQAPNAPTITTPIEGDNIVNSLEDNDVYVAGTAEKNSTVTVTFTDGTHTEQVTVTTNDQGEWNLTGNEVDLSGFNNGSIQVSATATDTAGNTSPAQTVDITLDNQTTPVTIETPIAQDNVINGSEDNGVVISGNAEPNSQVTVTITDGKNPPVTTQVTANNQGEWTTAGLDISGLDNGNLTVTANAVDLEGNPSNDSTTITLDNQAPNAPTITTPIEGDNIVNSVEDNDVYVAGTAEKNSTVKVTFTDGTHTEQVTVTTNDQGEWNLTGNEVDLSGFNNGSVQVSATATDTAGNTSAAQTVDITLDNQTTPVTIDTPIAQDNVINDSEDNGVVIKGNAEPNSQVTVTISDGKNPPVTTQVTANNQGEWTAAGLDISGLDNGNLTVTANAIDPEGNPSNDSTNITLDNQAPNAPTITTPIEGDNIVNSVEDNDVYVAGTAEKNSTVTVTFTDGTHTEQVTVTTNDQGEWNLTGNEVDLSGFNNGTIQVSATATDTAGNTSPAQTVDITLDNQTTPVTIDTPIAQDNVINGSEDNGVAIKGNAEAGSTVTITISDGKNPPVTTQVTANNQGEWTTTGLDISGLDNGNLTVTANAIDPEGNPSSDSTTITLDNQAPNAPTITTPIEGDNIVNSVEDNDVYVEGTAEKNSTVTVTFTDGTHTEQVTVTTNDQGEWNLTGNEVDLSGFNNGSVQVSATATDTAGNTSAAQTVNITLDNEAPTLNNLQLDLAENSAANTVVGNVDAGEAGVTFTFANGKQTSADGFFLINNSTGEITLTDAGAAASLLDFEASPNTALLSVVATDTAGNKTTEQVQINITNVDEAPTIVDVNLPAVNEDNSIVIKPSDLLANSSDPDGNTPTVTNLTLKDPTVGTLVANVDDGTWTFTPKQHYAVDNVELNFTVTSGSHSGAASAFIDVTAVADQPTLEITTGFTTKIIDVGKSLSSLSDVNFSDTPVQEEIVDSINFTNSAGAFFNGGPTNQFAALITGEINVVKGGVYTFTLGSDDGSQLLIDGVPVPGINNDGNHAYREESGSITLDPGVHTIEVRYYENGGHAGLKLEWQGPDTNNVKQLVTIDASGNVAGAEDTSIALPDIAGALVDTDSSETLTFSISNIPVGAVLTDGNQLFTAITNITTADITGWNLDSLSITPPANYHGSFDLSINATATEALNGDQATNSQQITVTVESVVDPIEAGNVDLGATQEDTSFVITEAQLLAQTNSPEGAPSITALSLADSSTGTLVNNNDGTWTFSPSNNFSGQNVALNFTATDGITQGNATATIDVVAVADSPIITQNSVATNTHTPTFSTVQDARSISNGVRLTPDQGNKQGAAWSTEKVDLTKDFTLNFELFFGSKNNGADGIVFVLQSQGNNAIGKRGGGEGYEGLNNSFGIEFDTYQNATDLSNDHAAFVANGVVSHNQGLGSSQDLGNIEDNRWHDVQVSWDASGQRLSYAFTTSNGEIKTGSIERDIVNQYLGGENQVWFGFTAGTGGASNTQSVRNVELSDTNVPLDISIAVTDNTEALGDVVISQVPTGVILSAGTDNGNGSWTVTQSQLSNLSLDTQSYSGDKDFNIVVQATSSEANGSTAATQQVINVEINGADTVTTGVTLTGTQNSDNILGGAGDDIIFGGLGSDTLTGNNGADKFIWQKDDANNGSVISPEEDHITDFAQGEDVLDVSDLLVGETENTIDNFLQINFDGTSTTIDVSPVGDNQVTQKIVLDNVNVSSQYGTTDSHIIVQNMIKDGTIVIDQ